jgi:hypothetical protein
LLLIDRGCLLLPDTLLTAVGPCNCAQSVKLLLYNVEQACARIFDRASNSLTPNKLCVETEHLFPPRHHRGLSHANENSKMEAAFFVTDRNEGRCRRFPHPSSPHFLCVHADMLRPFLLHRYLWAASRDIIFSFVGRPKPPAARKVKVLC